MPSLSSLIHEYQRCEEYARRAVEEIDEAVTAEIECEDKILAQLKRLPKGTVVIASGRNETTRIYFAHHGELRSKLAVYAHETEIVDAPAKEEPKLATRTVFCTKCKKVNHLNSEQWMVCHRNPCRICGGSIFTAGIGHPGDPTVKPEPAKGCKCRVCAEALKAEQFAERDGFGVIVPPADFLLP